MLFEFENKEDKNRIFDMYPWSVQEHCLSLQKWKLDIGIDDVDFTWIQFFVQIHNLGLESLTPRMRRELEISSVIILRQIRM